MSKLIVGVNDLVTINPELTKEWNYKENDKLSIKPNEVTCGSGKKVWWICSNCGHEWQASINLRSKGTGCPECAKQRRKKKKE